MLNFLSKKMNTFTKYFSGPTEAQKTKVNTFTKKYIYHGDVYQGPDEAKIAKINEFIKVFLESQTLSQALSQRTRMTDKIDYLKNYTFDLDLNDAQLYTLIQAKTRVIDDIEKILALQHNKKLNPALKLALQTSLCLAATYLTPELFALYTTTQALAAFIKPHLGLYDDLADYLATHGLGFTLASLGSVSGNTVSSRLNQYIIPTIMPTFITNLPWYFRIPLMLPILIPASISVSIPSKHLLENALEPIKQLGELITSPEVTENASDFFDVMYGQTDNATLEKHQGSLACKSMGEIGEDCVKGLRSMWNSLPAFFNREQTTPKSVVPQQEKTKTKNLKRKRRSSPSYSTNRKHTRSVKRHKSS